MIRTVEFLKVATFDPYEDGVSLLAMVDSRLVRCVVSLDALVECFGIDPLDPLPGFASHREEVERAADRLIRAGRDRQGSLNILARDLGPPHARTLGEHVAR